MQKIKLIKVKRKTKFPRSFTRKVVEKAYADILTPEIRKIKDPLKKAKAMLRQAEKLAEASKNS